MFERFYAPQLYRQVLLRRVLAMGILSVCPSVTIRCRTKPGWDRDSGSSPYDSLESLVSNEVISCRWVMRFPSNEGIKEGYPPQKSLFYHYWLIAWKRLQIDTDLLLIITSTADELSSGLPTSVTLNDLEPQNRRFSEFSGSERHYISNHAAAPQCATAYNAICITFLITRRRQCAMAYFSWVWYL